MYSYVSLHLRTFVYIYIQLHTFAYICIFHAYPHVLTRRKSLPPVERIKVDMDALETRLQRSMEMIEQKKRRLDLTRSQLTVASQTKQSTLAAIFSFGGMIKNSQVRQVEDNIAKLEEDISGLKGLTELIKADLNIAQYTMEQVMLSRTLKGRLWQVLGIFFSFYCIYRLFTGTINVVWRSNEPYHMALDPVTKFLKHLEIFQENDLIFWSQQISFLLVSTMIILSIRSLLLNLQKVC